MQVKFLAQERNRFRQGQPLPLGRAADDHQRRPGGAGGGDLLVKAPGGAGILGDEILCPHTFQHGNVHIKRKRPLHGEDMGRLQSRTLAQVQRFLHGEHPGVDPVCKII